MEVKRKRIYVGLSGGVDSAVSAALLKDAGAEVTGVFIKGWYPPGLPCTWASERRDAMLVAARIGIPFETLDASKEYKEAVIDYLLTEYRGGRTPNPDVMCNREVKFGAFYHYARAQGADGIATGHYRSGEKDQSYFLWAVPRDVLEHSYFPVGHLSKDQVRALARKFDIPVAEKKDSQGICFLGSVSVDQFLRQEIGASPGIAINSGGAQIGTHDGAVLYTLGERVSLTHAPTGPWYVIKKDIARNELTVAHERVPENGMNIASIKFTDANWLIDDAYEVEAQYRYRSRKLRGVVQGNAFKPTEPLEESPAPGQSIVFYRDGQLAGGGIIAS